jgi:hypothetical protein
MQTPCQAVGFRDRRCREANQSAEHCCPGNLHELAASSLDQGHWPAAKSPRRIAFVTLTLLVNDTAAATPEPAQIHAG